jgi:adenine-specific DNA-methyltransferase
MSRPARSRPSGKREVDDYRHDEAQRLNNPEAGLARHETEKPPTKRYDYDPHMDPQLVWTGKSERSSFEVDAVSIHVHERLSTEAIITTLRKEQPQLALFGDPELDRDREVEFYQHEVDWTNRLILGDSLVVMTSLLERERLAGQVQCIYFDPPLASTTTPTSRPGSPTAPPATCPRRPSLGSRSRCRPTETPGRSASTPI